MIGTTTEGEATADNLTIADTGHCGITIRSGDDDVGTIFFSDATSGTAEYVGYVQYDHSGNFMKWQTNGSEHLRLESDGKLSLGRQNATPHFELFYNHSDGNDYKASLQLNGNDLEVRGSSGVIEFFTGAVDGASSTLRMLVDASGNLMVGKSSSDGGVAGFEARPNGIVYATLSSGSSYYLHDTSSNKFYVNANGGIYNYQSNDSNLSDKREKKNISSLGSKWDAVKKWSLKEFHYNADADSDSKKCGVIAQDMETDHPELVTEFDLTDTDKRKAVKEQQMTWMAIKALQEAMAKIETLEAKVAKLEE